MAAAALMAAWLLAAAPQEFPLAALPFAIEGTTAIEVNGARVVLARGTAPAEIDRVVEGVAHLFPPARNIAFPTTLQARWRDREGDAAVLFHLTVGDVDPAALQAAADAGADVLAERARAQLRVSGVLLAWDTACSLHRALEHPVPAPPLCPEEKAREHMRTIGQAMPALGWRWLSLRPGPGGRGTVWTWMHTADLGALELMDGDPVRAEERCATVAHPLPPESRCTLVIAVRTASARPGGRRGGLVVATHALDARALAERLDTLLGGAGWVPDPHMDSTSAARLLRRNRDLLLLSIEDVEEGGARFVLVEMAAEGGAP